MSDFWSGAIWASLFWIVAYCLAVVCWAIWDMKSRGEMMNTEAANDRHEDFTIPARIKASVGRVTISGGSGGSGGIFGSTELTTMPSQQIAQGNPHPSAWRGLHSHTWRDPA